MLHRIRTPSLATALVATSISCLWLTAGQAQIADSVRGAADESNHFIATPDGWQHPMTPWGEPDIRAMLDMMQASRVPLERCADRYASRTLPTFLFGGSSADGSESSCDMDRAWLAEAEYARRIEAWRERRDVSRQALAEGDLGRSLRTGTIDPNIPQRQTSLIVDPATGMLPPLTSDGKRRALEMHSSWALPGENHRYDRATDFDSWDRCITRGMPSSMMPYRYNGGFRIMQAPGYVIFQLEMIHEARIIPTGDRAPLPSEVKKYLGDSRGHWEGTTLVVETTNYREGPPMINLAVLGSPPGNRFPYSDRMKTTERIVRLNDEWWLYEITTEDPVVLSRPFTVRYPMRHDPTYSMPEYACHEDNTIVRNYIETNRYERNNEPETEPEPADAAPEIADALAGRWTGSPRIVTLDLTIELEFERTSSDSITGELIGTNLGAIGEPLENLSVDGRALNFELPNWQPWAFSGRLTADDTLVGVFRSAQGGVPVTLSRIESR